MGCDIHLRTFVYSSNTDEYICVSKIYNHNLDEYLYQNKLAESAEFPEIVGDRNYQLFNILGNDSRFGCYDFLDDLEFGYPDFFEKQFKEDCDDPDWYGFVHIDLNTLEKSVTRYLNEHNTKGVDCSLKSILKDIKRIREISKSPMFKIQCDLLGYNIDIEKTAFVMWFDN